MISKSITSKFYGDGEMLISDSNSNSLLSVDKITIQNSFKKKGCIIFRNFQTSDFSYKEFIDRFTKVYANDTNDTLRRKKTNISKFVRHVDAGNLKMSLHSEASFSPSWPEIVWFYCKTPCKKDGEITICDGVKLWENLSEKTKSFFLANPLKYKLKIPLFKENKKGVKKKWFINSVGSYDSFLDYKKGELNMCQIRFAVNEINHLNKLAFSNHVLHEKPYIDKTIQKWGTIFDKKIPKKIIEEVKKVSDKFTYFHKWEKDDLIMLDNRRFMHSRNHFNKNDSRVILNTQTLKSNFLNV